MKKKMIFSILFIFSMFLIGVVLGYFAYLSKTGFL